MHVFVHVHVHAHVCECNECHQKWGPILEYHKISMYIIKKCGDHIQQKGHPSPLIVILYNTSTPGKQLGTMSSDSRYVVKMILLILVKIRSSEG